MRKLLPLVLALLLLLSACGIVKPTSSPFTSQSTVPESQTVTENTNDSFRVTKEKYISTIDEQSAKYEFIAIASVTPSIVESDDIKSTFAYPLCPGFTLYLDEDNSTKELLNISMHVDRREISIDNVTYFGFVCTVTAHALDGSNGKAIIDKLNTTDVSKDTINSVDSEYFSYSYIVDGDSVIYSVTPRK